MTPIAEDLKENLLDHMSESLHIFDPEENDLRQQLEFIHLFLSEIAQRCASNEKGLSALKLKVLINPDDLEETMENFAIWIEKKVY